MKMQAHMRSTIVKRKSEKGKVIHENLTFEPLKNEELS